jgi:hypothetical protein
MAGSKTHLIQNAREMGVSTDLTRVGQLAAREQQNADMADSVRADFYNPLTGIIDDFGATHRAAAYEPIPEALVAPSLDPVGGSWNMTLGAGEVEGVQSGVASPDVSSYGVARWPQQVVTGLGPSNTNPTIATIYVVPSDVQADQASRNILLDPVARTYQPQNVYKTSNPSGTIGVVVGTAAANPLPPALPTNAIALFDVYVPTSATDTTTCRITRRCWRRIEFPGTSQHGIVKGCVPTWAYAAEATGAAPQLLTTAINRLVIDGELLTFAFSGGAITFSPDTNNSPTAAAPATNDMPTYLYLCGGRHWPWSNGAPVQGVESLTAPDSMGYPSAAMAIAAGSGSTTIPRSAAVFIGNGFRVAGSTRSKSLIYDGDWVRPQAHTPVSGFPTSGGCSIQGFYEANVTDFGGGAFPSLHAFNLAGIPAPSTVVEIQADILITSGPIGVFMINSCVGGPQVLNIPAAQLGTQVQSARAKIARPASDNVEFYATAGITSASTMILNIRPTGFNMNIPRIGR